MQHLGVRCKAPAAEALPNVDRSHPPRPVRHRIYWVDAERRAILFLDPLEPLPHDPLPTELLLTESPPVS